MKRDTEAKDDIRIIKLCRKPIASRFQQRDANYENQNQNSFFATDYFDTLEQTPLNISDSLPEILGISTEKISENGKITMQGYTLYSSVLMQNEYEKKERKYAGNPFEENKMPFLSIIQVHITPEIFARVEKEKAICRETIFLKHFLEDIYQIIDETVNTDPRMNNQFVARVYQQLSSGDIAVVIKSYQATTSYKISTAIRKRVINLNSNASEMPTTPIVIYKTYTLLTIDDMIIEAGLSEESQIINENNRYVIRCVYSNKYWAMNEAERKKWESDYQNVERNIHRLNGRYDLSLEFSEEEFHILLPEIKKYKNSNDLSSNKDNGKPLSDKGLYLMSLMKNEYISYINERYLLCMDKNTVSKESNSCIIAECCKKENNILFMEDSNDRRIKELKEKYSEIKKEFKDVKGYRKNIEHNMLLLSKEISMCTDINKLSDTRIYATVLLEQLEIVIDCMKEYIKLYKDSNGNQSILEEYEACLQKVVYTIDQYAQYIRNNNMQSLQTPNYNIESSAGMDKLLISYSELLRIFMNYYLKEVQKEGETKFLPVMVPNLLEGNVRVEVLFPEIIVDFEPEMKTERKKLLIVNSATLAEVSNMPFMLTSLFHEVAHQFRYEDRRERNAVLLEYALMKALEPTAENIIQKFLYDNNIIGEEYIISELLVQNMAEAILECRFNKKTDNEKVTLDYKYQNLPLSNFREYFEKDITAILTACRDNQRIQQKAELFVSDIVQGSLASNSSVILAISKFAKALDELLAPIKKNDNEELKEKIKSVEKAAFEMLWACAEKMQEKNLSIDTEKTFEENWKNCFGLETGKITTEMWKKFYFYAASLWSLEKSPEKVGNIYEQMYHNIRKAWREQLESCLYYEQNKEENLEYADYKKMPFYQYWAVLGRYLGVDYDTSENSDRFIRLVKESIDTDIRRADEAIAEYREETSDIFMCSVVPLTSFGYIKFMAITLPMDMGISDTYIQRIIRVICAKKEISNKQQFYKECKCIMVNFLNFAGSKFEEERKELEIILQKEEIDEEGIHGLYLIINATKSKADKEMLKEETKKEETFYLIYRICLLLEKIIDEGDVYVQKICKNAMLKNDYEGGGRFLNNLPNKMKAKEGIIKQISEVSDSIAEYFNNTNSKSQDINMEINRKCIHLILEAYYNNKFYYAEKAVFNQ